MQESNKRQTSFQIPDGEYIGDFFFITDHGGKVLMAFAWTGDRWMHEYEVVNIQE